MPRVFAHIVTWNSSDAVLKAISALLSQEGFGESELTVKVTDNASKNGIFERIEESFKGRVQLWKNNANLGFCGAHNQGASHFLQGDYDYYFILNPDVRLKSDALLRLVLALEEFPAAGSACPKLFRADSDLDPVNPPLLDAAGMEMTSAIRHFDRGSNLPDGPEYSRSSVVFGGSGAALIMRRAFVEDALFDCGEREADLFKVYPQLEDGFKFRAHLFDEAFFAYREDADLAWRGNLLGWKCLYVAEAVGWHKRVVLPENREALPPALNALGVKNRFLLELNNLRPLKEPRFILAGLIIRNLVVLAGVFLRERSSITALKDALRLAPRALAGRRKLMDKFKERTR